MPTKLKPLDRGRLNDLIQLLAQHDQLSSQLAAVAAQRTLLAVRRDQLLQTRTGLVTQRRAAEKEAERLNKEYTRLDIEANQHQANIIERQKKVNSLRRDVQELSDTVAALQGQVADLQDQIAKQKRQLQKLAAQVGLIAENKQELVRQRTAAEAEATKAGRLMAAYERALAGVDQPLARLRERLLLLGDNEDVANQRAALQGRVAHLKSQRETIVLRGRGQYLRARKAIQDAAARVSDIDGEIQRLDAERARPARQYRTLELQTSDKLDQLAELRSQCDKAAAQLASHKNALAGEIQQLDAVTRDHKQAVADRDAAGRKRDVAKEDSGKLQEQVISTQKGHDAAVKDHWLVDNDHTRKAAAVKRVASDAVTALADAVGVAANGLTAIQTGIATFGTGLPKIPAVVQAALIQLNTQRTQLEVTRTHIAPLDIASAPAHVQPLTNLFGDIDNVITAFNAEIDRTKPELDNEFAAISHAIEAAVMLRSTGAAEYNNAVFVDNQMNQQQSLRKVVSDHIRTNKDACLVNHAPVQAALLMQADELLRRYRIFLLRAKYNQVCFTDQVPQVLKACLAAAGTTPVAAENQVRNLRLTPAMRELRTALDVPTGGGWTMWGSKSQYDGKEIHVTISNNSIKLPGAAINTFPSGAVLFNAMFFLADHTQEVHSTLKVPVNSEGKHPAVFISGNDKLWDQYERYCRDRGDTVAIAQQHRASARAAVVALLHQWQTSMIARCQLLINRIAQGHDILGKPLP